MKLGDDYIVDTKPFRDMKYDEIREVNLIGDWTMDKAVLYSLLEQYIDSADKKKIVLDIKRAFTDRDIEILLREASYLTF